MATESNQAVLFEGLFEQAKLYRAQRDALLLAADAALVHFNLAEGRTVQIAALKPAAEVREALRAAILAAKGGAK